MSAQTQRVSEYEKAQKALDYISPDCGRDTWVRIAAALKDEFGDDSFELFDNWSSGGKSYEVAAVRDTWKSVKGGHGITVATLYHEAKQGGFRPGEWRTQESPPQITHDDAKRAAANAARDLEDARRHEKAAKKAVEVFAAGRVMATDHPYVVRKHLADHPWLQVAEVAPREMNATDLAEHLGYTPKADGTPLSGRVLLIPMIDGRAITTLEFIDECGRKTALAGGHKKGAWSTPIPMNKHLEANPKPIIIVEGWATSYSMQRAFSDGNEEMPSAYVVAAGADTNLGNVARALHAMHPQSPILIGADVGNPGSMKLAFNAAREVGGKVIEPEFTVEQLGFLEKYLGKAPTDFNDLDVYYAEKRLPREDLQFHLRHSVQMGKYPDVAEKHIIPDAGRFFREERFVAQQLGDRTMEEKSAMAPAESAAAPVKGGHESGALLFDINNIPPVVRDTARSVFGSRHTIYPPRENAGPYNGEVYNIPGYLIQEVGPRSLVIHDKSKLEFANDRLKWMDANQKLNGHELALHYNGDKAKAYPFDQVRDNLAKAVASFKKSGKELGFDTAFGQQIDRAFDQSMSRIREMRREASGRDKAPAAPEPEKVMPKR